MKKEKTTSEKKTKDSKVSKVTAIVASILAIFAAAISLSNCGKVTEAKMEKAHNELVEELKADFADDINASTANWSEFDILCIYNKDGKVHIESYVPVDEEEYIYCTFLTTGEKECKNIQEVNKNYSSETYTTESNLVNESYYVLSDEMKEFILQHSEAKEDFFKNENINTYLALKEDDKLTIYNTLISKVVTITNYVENGSLPINSVNYKDYTEEDLKKAGYVFVYTDLDKNKDKGIEK